MMLALAAYRFYEVANQTTVVSEVSPVRVETLVVKEQPLATWVFAEGTAQALRKAYLNFEQPGKVVYLGKQADGSVIREGARVFGPTSDTANGQLLARLDNRENASQVEALEARLQSMQERRLEAKNGITRAENDLRQANADFQRIEKIFSQGVVSRDEYERYRTAQLNAEVGVDAANNSLRALVAEAKSVAAELNAATVSLEKTSLFAPFDGVISSVNVLEENHYYPPGMINSDSDRESSSAIVVVDDSSYEIQLEISEEDALGIKEGQRVFLASDDRELYRGVNNGFEGNRIAEGYVWSVSPMLSLRNRSHLVKVRTSEPAEVIRDGMFVRAWVATKVQEDTLTIPWQVLSFRDSRPYVYVLVDGNRVEQRWLTLGIQGLDQVEVLDGIENGEQVITRGQHLLVTGSKVQVLGAAQ